MSFPEVFLCEAGYRIAIVLIDNTPSVAKERSMSRFMKEGRYADDSYIEAPKRTKNKRLGGLFFPTEMTCKKRWVFTEWQPLFRKKCKFFCQVKMESSCPFLMQSTFKNVPENYAKLKEMEQALDAT